MPSASEYLWLIVLLPFLGAAGNAVLGPRVDRKWTTAVALGAPGLSLLLALLAILERLTTAPAQAYQQALYTWSAAGISIDVGFMLDQLSAVMLFVVTFVGFLIHVYSVGYMAHETGYQRYFVYLNLFMGSMLLLILGSNFLVTFVGWEGVGLCSYLLIGYYYDQKFPPYAGRKAFIVNRIGDFAFLVGLFALVARFGTLDYGRVASAVNEAPQAAQEPYLLGLSFAGFVGLCLFIGAMGKSAQIPLYVWLPDAMAGPTPVSALIHAATMVTAGVYMLARTSFLYQLTEGVSGFVAVIGAATALLAATIGLAQTDIKKVLAYSTVSQLGYMFLAAGVGAYGVAIFHLATHAFFKALLFLGSGSVIHAMSGEQDMRQMGGLKSKLPSTYKTMLIGTLAISGVPLLSGFFSKDQILAAAWGASKPLWVVGVLTAGLTACYMTRLLLMTFWGEFRGSEEQRAHLHESPAVMTVPLWVLAIGAVAAGYVGIPKLGHFDVNLLGHYLEPVFQGAGAHEAHHASLAVELILMAASVAIAAAGIWLAWKIYGPGRELAGGESWAGRYPKAHRLLVNKYWVDEAYDATVVRPLAAVSRFFFRVVDGGLIEGAVHAGPNLSKLVGEFSRLTTTGNVRNYALYFLGGVLLLLWWLMA